VDWIFLYAGNLALIAVFAFIVISSSISGKMFLYEFNPGIAGFEAAMFAILIILNLREIGGKIYGKHEGSMV
jgi:hypothetical protein